MVWDIYDGVRTGLAKYKGKPHYFSSIFEEEFTEKFEISPVNEKFLELAVEQWKIYREWEFLYHSGKEVLEKHPGHGGINKLYDEIEVKLKKGLSGLKKLNSVFCPNFRVLPDQEHLPSGVLKEIEVQWHVVT